MKPKLFSLLILLANGALVLAADWPQYRGPNHDGVSQESIRLNWAQVPPKVLWKVAMPPGLSSLSIAQGRVFTMGSRFSGGQETEYCLALDAQTGQELWASPIGRADYPNGGVGSDDGPRSTPTVETDRVYVFGSYMNLVCLNAATGAEYWRRNLENEFQSKIIPWQNAASPLLVGDLIFVNSNGRSGEHLLAFRKSDGSLAWKTGSDGMTQASPVHGVIAGVPQVVFFAQSGLVAVVPETGRVLWRFPLNYNGTSVAASPVIAGDTVYASRAYPASLTRAQAGAVVVKLARNGDNFTAARQWAVTNSLMNHWATPVHHKGFFYGNYGQNSLNLRCVDATSGATKWQVSRFGYGSVTVVNDKLLVLGDDGELVLAEPSTNAYTELAAIQPLNGKCWNNLAISGGRIYIRSTLEAVALDVSLAQPPPLPLTLGLTRAPAGSMQVTLGASDAALITPQRQPAISVYSTRGLPAAGAAWTKESRPVILSNGRLLFEIPASEAAAGQKFFRAEERP